MIDWFLQPFEENSILWLLIASVIGGFIGASAKFVFDIMLPRKLQQKRQLITVKRKYATPILFAADELRSRFKNMITHIEEIEHQGWMSDRVARGYYYTSTLYVVGQFFGWLDILRRTVIYLDLTTTKETRKFERFLMAIESGLSNPALLKDATTGDPAYSDDKWVPSFWLQAIGALMVTRDGKEYRTLDYASFHKKLSQSPDAELKTWFDPLTSMFQDLKAGDVRFRRIVATHAILNAFIEYSDPKHLRTDPHSYYWELLSEQEVGRIKERIAGVDAQ